MVITQIGTVPVLLYLDQVHLLLLAITTIVSLETLELLILMITIHQIFCGMGMVAIMLIITAVPTLTCLGSSDNFHSPFKIILKQGFATEIDSVILILLWKVLNCTYSEMEDTFTTVSYTVSLHLITVIFLPVCF